MLTTNAATAEKNYTLKMSSGNDALKTESQTHTQSEIIDRAKEVLAKEMSQDLASFADLKNKGESDIAYYVDKSGRPAVFTKEMQFKAALAVLNSKDQHFEAISV